MKYSDCNHKLKDIDISPFVKDGHTMKYIVGINNYSFNIALHLQCYVYHPRTHNYLLAAQSLESLNPQQYHRFCVVDEYLDRPGIEEKVMKKYGEKAHRIFNAFDSEDKPFCVIIFEDQLGKIHATKKKFEEKEDGTILHDTSTLIHEE